MLIEMCLEFSCNYFLLKYLCLLLSLSVFCFIYNVINQCRLIYVITLSCQIGSSPGFEDGVFESSKLMRPAASFYDAYEDCLYIVDSEVFVDLYALSI